MPRSQARGAPAAPSPASRLGSVAKAPATHDGAPRAGERAGAFGQPSGVRAAAAVGAHVNGTRVRGGHSTPHMPAPSACSCPLLHQPPSSLGDVSPMGWQHPTVPPKTSASQEPRHAVPAPVTLVPAQSCPTCSQAALCPDTPQGVWAPCGHPSISQFSCITLPGPPVYHHQMSCPGHAAPPAP